MSGSSFLLTRQPDTPTALGAGHNFDAADRRKIDEQILALQQFVSQCLINGIVGSVFVADPNQPAIQKGDVVTLSALRNYMRTATSAAIASVNAVTGIAMTNAAAGSPFVVAMKGLVPRSVTGLGAVAGNATLASSGRLEIGGGGALIGVTNAYGVTLLKI